MTQTSCIRLLHVDRTDITVLSIWQVPSPGLTKTDLGLSILLNG